MATRPFGDLSRSRQRELLREAATDALARYGITGAALRLVNFDFNATYRVDTKQGRFALRLNINSDGTFETTLGEAAWVAALGEVDGINVATPQRTADGELATAVPCRGIEQPLPTVLYSWLDGPDVGEGASRTRLRELGRLTARLHRHAESWTPPAGVTFKSVDSMMMDVQDNLSTLEAPWYDATSKSVIDEALAAATEATADVFTRSPRHLIHGDLHVWNVKWVDGSIAVLDFDDAGWGRPLHDLAITAFYLRDEPGAEDAVREGYELERPLPTHTSEEFEALMAGRNLLLLNDIAASVTAGHDDFVPGYCARTVKRMRTWLDTGRFELDVD